jgi:DNA-binding LytR/AlgR family response regulator
MEIMQTYVHDCPQLETAGACSDAFAASEALQQENVDLIFLDINLPRLSGLSFLKTLSRPPLVIFTTAYPEYAVDGFEADAVDYLVKPFSFDRFLKAVNKAFDKVRSRQNSETTGPDSTKSFILLRADKKTYKVNLPEILYIEAIGDYLKIFMTGRKLVVHETIKGLLDQLPSDQFLRIHKSYVASIGQINYIEGNQLHIGSAVLPIGRSYKEEVEKQLVALSLRKNQPASPNNEATDEVSDKDPIIHPII